MKGGLLSSYFKSLATGYVVTAATVLVGIALLPFVLHHLDKERYAIFVLASDTLMWLGLLEIGVSSVLNVRVAQLSGRKEEGGITEIACTTFFFQTGVAVVVALLGVLAAEGFGGFFSISAANQSDARSLFICMALGAALQIGTQTFSSILIGYQQAHVDNILKLILLAIRTLLTVVLLNQGLGLISLGIAQLASVVVSGALSMVRAYMLMPSLKLDIRRFDGRLLRELAGQGAWFTVGGVAGLLIMNVDKMVAARLVSVESVTVLTVTGRLYLLAWTLIQQMTNAARPAMARLYGHGQLVDLTRSYRQLKFISVGFAIVGAMTIWASNELFVSWWVGSTHYGGAGLDLLLALNILAHAWVLPNRAILVSAMKFVPENAISRIIEGVLNISLSIFLGARFGLPGIIAATGIAAVLVSSWYFPLLTSRCLGVSAGLLYRGLLLRLGLLVAMMSGAALLLRHITSGTAGILPVIAVTGLAGGTGAVMLLLLAEADVRMAVLSFIRRLLGGRELVQ